MHSPRAVQSQAGSGRCRAMKVLTIVSDRTGTIQTSITDVQFTLVLSVGLVVMVVLLFLRTW